MPRVAATLPPEQRAVVFVATDPRGVDELSWRVVDRNGREIVAPASRKSSEAVSRIEIDLRALAPGSYGVEVEARAAGQVLGKRSITLVIEPTKR